MKQIIALLLGVAVFVISTFAAAYQPDGFSYFLQHYAIGSKDVLMFETHSTAYGKERFGVAPEFVDDNLEMLNKFLKWAAMARERGDMVNKEIDTVTGFDFGAYNFYNRYEFETDASRNYFLKVTALTKLLFKFVPHNPNESAPPSGVNIVRVMSFSEDQVKDIIKRLQEFKDGKLRTKEEVEKDYK